MWKNGHTLNYAMAHPRNGKRRHYLPRGWRWLKVGEWVKAGDVGCDPRIAKVAILKSWGYLTPTHHPVQRKID
jgi:hypothetical protein